MISGKYYKAVKIDGEKRDLHRVIAEQRLGRKLKPNEVVHHIDGDKLNNDPDNLCVMTRGEHARLHLKGKPISEEQKRRLSEYHKGKPNYHCRTLSRKKVFEILSLLDQKIPTRKIAAALKVKRSAVTGIYYGQYYKDWVSEYYASKIA